MKKYRKAKWIDVKDFAKVYNVSTDNVYVQRHNGTLPAEIFKTITPRTILINENFLKRRIEFKTEVIKRNEAVYYELLETMTASKMARAYCDAMGISERSLRTWLSGGLWGVSSRMSILHYKIPKVHYKFFRATRRVKCTDYS